MDGQNPQQQNHAISGADSDCAYEGTRNHKSRQVIDGVLLVTPRTMNNIAGPEEEKAEGAFQRLEGTDRPNTGLPNITGSAQLGSEGIRGSEHVVRGIPPNIQNIREREDVSSFTPRVGSSGTQPLACNRTPDIGGSSMNNNANAIQIVLDKSDANQGAEGSGKPREGGSGRIIPVAPASTKVSHNQTATGIVTPNASRNTIPRVRTLKQPGYRTGDPIICVYCMDSQGIGSSCPKCGKHNNKKARRYVPGERPDMCLPINDKIASGSVPGSPRVGSASVSLNPESPIQTEEETPREFQYNSGHGAPGNQRVASAQAQIAAQLPGQFGNGLSSGSNAASLTSEQNTNSEMQRCASTDTGGANLGDSSTQQSSSAQEVTLRMRGFGNGMHPGETPGFLGNLSRAIQSNSAATLSQLENNNSAVNRSSGVGDPVSPASGHVGSSAIRRLFGGRRITLSSKQQRGRTDLGAGRAPGTQQGEGMEPVAPSMPSGRHRAGGNIANAYANANGGGYTNGNGFDTNANGYPRANSAGYPGNANGVYPNGAYSNGCQFSAGAGTPGNQGKDDGIRDPMYLIYPHDSASVGDKEKNKNNADRGSKSLQANLYDKEVEERVICNSQSMGTQNMDRQNAGLTGYPYEQVVSNPVSYHPLRNQMDAQAGLVRGIQSGMQGMEDHPGMSKDGIDSQTGSQNRGSRIRSRSMSEGNSSKKASTLGSVMSGTISVQGLISTLKGSLRGGRKSTKNADSMNASSANGQKDSFKEQQFQNQIETSSASRSPPRPPAAGSLQQGLPANGAMQQMQMQNNLHMMNQVQAGPSAMSTNVNSTSPSAGTLAPSMRAPSMHTQITHTPNIPLTSMHMPTANNMHSEQVAQQQALTLQQAQRQHVADAVARQQLMMSAKRELEVERAKAANMAVIRASQRLGSAPQKSNGDTSLRQEKVVTLPRIERALTSPRQERDGEFENRDAMIAAPRGEKRTSPKDSSKSKKENKKQSSQQMDQEQNVFKEQGQEEAGFQLSKRDGSTQVGSRNPSELPIRALSTQARDTGISGSIRFGGGASTDSGFAQGNPGDGGWANVPAGAKGNDVAVKTSSYKGIGDSHFDPCQNAVSCKNRAAVNQKIKNFEDVMNFGDSVDNGLNFNGIYGMSITVPTKHNGIGVSGSPSGNNTRNNKEYEHDCNSLLNSVDLNKVSGLVSNSEVINNSKKALNSVDAVNNVRNSVPVSSVNVSVVQLHKEPTPRSSIQGDSLVEINRVLDELEKAKEHELLIYSRDNSIVDGVGFLRRELSVNDPLAAMIDHDYSSSGYDRADTYTGCDGAASHRSGPESNGLGTSQPSQSGDTHSGANDLPQPASGPQSPHCGSLESNHSRNGRKIENAMEMGYWSDGNGNGMGKCDVKEEKLL